MSYGDYPDLSTVRRILVMKLRHLGDVLLTTPVFSTLTKALPGAVIDVCIYAEAAPLLRGHPFVRSLLLYDKAWKQGSFFQRMKKEWALIRAVQLGSYDLVIQLTEGDRGAFLSWMSRARYRVGWAHGQKRFVYTHLAKNCPFLRHTVERQLDPLRRIGLFPQEEDKELFVPRCVVAEAAMAQRLPFSEFVLIHPTSRWRFKCWPVQQMKELARVLIERGENLVFSAGPDKEEERMVAEIVDGLDATHVFNVSGRLSLLELGALIEKSRLLVAVDSLPFHWANALKKPVVALFGPTSEVTWGPWRNPWARVVVQAMSCRPCYQDGCGGSKRSECLYQLRVEKVLEPIEELLYTARHKPE